MGELVHLIDTASQSLFDDFASGLVESALDGNYEGLDRDPHDLIGFVKVSSAFYPQLARYYELRSELWADKRRRGFERDG